jgi:hypothetical protein
MTFEARLLFVAAFFLLWGVLGFLSWACAAVWRRGRGVLPALPFTVLSAWLGGLAVPLVAGARDERGLLLSVGTALVCGALGTVGGLYLTEQLIEPAGRAGAGGKRAHRLDSDRDY